MSTSKPFTVTSFCRVCESACGITVTLKDGCITAIAPDREHVVSRGYACKKGLSFHEIDQSPDRLRHPLKRTGERWEAISWKQALREIGGRVRAIRAAHGPNAIAAYAGNGSGWSLPHAFALQGFMDGLGSKSLYSASSQDCANKFAVAEWMYGSPVIQVLPDFDRSNCFILVGANPAASKLSFASAPNVLNRMKQAAARGCRIFHVNPRRTETARAVGTQVFIRPGTDVFFLLAFAGELVRAHAVDHDAVTRHMKNFDAFADLVRPWTPERVAAVTGIPPAVLCEMAEAFRTADGAALYCSTGVNHGPHPALCFWIIEAVNAFTGNLDRAGGTLVGRGIIDLPSVAKKSGTLTKRNPSRITGQGTVMDCFPGALLPEEIATPGPGQMRAFFVSGGNPLLSFPDSARTESALRELELLVCIDIFRNETANLAHYILPAVSPFQHADINFVFQSMMGIMNTPFVNYTDALRPPDGDQRDELWIYRALSRAAGVPFFGSRALAAVLAVERVLSRIPLAGRAFTLTYEKLFSLMLRHGAGTSVRKMRRRHPHGKLLEPLQGGSFLGSRVLTADGKVDLAPAAYLTDAERLNDDFARELGAARTLRLVNMREALSHNSYYHNAPSCVGGERATNRLYLNPADAQAAGLADGDLAMVTSVTGSVYVPVRLTDDMMPGAAALPHGWGHGSAAGLETARRNAGVNVNYLTPSGPGSVDPLSGMARLSAIDIRIRRAGE